MADRGEGRFDPASGFGSEYRRFFDLDLGQRFETIHCDNATLAVQIFEPSVAVNGGAVGGTAVVVHGYYDHVGLYGHLIRYLLARGIRVIAYDQQGHGLSSGPRAAIDDFEHYALAFDRVLDGIRDCLTGPLWAIGQSMGGSVLVEYFLRGFRPVGLAPTFEHIVLLAPLVRPMGWGFGKWVHLAAKPFVRHVGRGVSNNANNPEFKTLLARDPLQARQLSVRWVTAMRQWIKRVEAIDVAPEKHRITVFQGGKDFTVDARYSIPLLERLFELDLVQIPEARHHLVNEHPDVRAKIWARLDSVGVR